MQLFNQSKVVLERCKMVSLVTTKINTKNEIEGAEKLWENLCIPPWDLSIPSGIFFLTRFILVKDVSAANVYIFVNPHV